MSSIDACPMFRIPPIANEQETENKILYQGVAECQRF